MKRALPTWFFGLGPEGPSSSSSSSFFLVSGSGSGSGFSIFSGALEGGGAMSRSTGPRAASMERR